MPTATPEETSTQGELGEVHLPDVNVLVALTFPDHVHHGRALSWFEQVPAYATTPLTESALVRHALNPRVAGQQLTGAQALAILAGVRSDPRARLLADDSTLADPEVDLSVLAGHRQVTDLHLLNLAARSGAVLVTLDQSVERSLVPADLAHVRVLP